MRRPPRSPLFPSTTLFRSHRHGAALLKPSGPAASGGEVEGTQLADVDGGAVTEARHQGLQPGDDGLAQPDRKSTRLNSSHANISYAVFCLKKRNKLRSLYA